MSYAVIITTKTFGEVLLENLHIKPKKKAPVDEWVNVSGTVHVNLFSYVNPSGTYRLRATVYIDEKGKRKAVEAIPYVNIELFKEHSCDTCNDTGVIVEGSRWGNSYDAFEKQCPDCMK